MFLCTTSLLWPGRRRGWWISCICIWGCTFGGLQTAYRCKDSNSFRGFVPPQRLLTIVIWVVRLTSYSEQVSSIGPLLFVLRFAQQPRPQIRRRQHSGTAHARTFPQTRPHAQRRHPNPHAHKLGTRTRNLPVCTVLCSSVGIGLEEGCTRSGEHFEHASLTAWLRRAGAGI